MRAGGLLPEEDTKDLLDQAYYLNVLGFDKLLGSVRQANRVLEALEFTLLAVAGEVRLRDFVVLEVLRICHPSVYERVLSRQDYLLGVGERMFGRDLSLAGKQEEAASLVKEAVEYVALGTTNGDQSTAVSNLLRELFQLAQWAHRGSGFGGSEFVTQWQNDRRVSAPEVFRTATAWALPEHVAPSGLIRELAEIEDAARLRSRLEELATDSRTDVGLAHLVDCLEDYAIAVVIGVGPPPSHRRARVAS